MPRHDKAFCCKASPCAESLKAILVPHHSRLTIVKLPCAESLKAINSFIVHKIK